METTVQNYIIRIYRYKKDDPRILVGVAEEVGVEGMRAFTNLDGLWDILTSAAKGKRETRKAKN
ncbi:MAG: hypothetical protein AB1442_17820 [Nitrospirota bacterium]